MNSICRLDSCLKKRAKESTLCSMHLWRWHKYKSFDLPPKKQLPPGVLKICKIHGELHQESVYKDKSPSGNRIYICKTCKKQFNQKHLAKNPSQTYERRKIYQMQRQKYDLSAESLTSMKYRLKKKFNLTLEQYEKMVEHQNNLCFICKNPETNKKRNKLAIDHCHKTGKVRALLCNNCNTMIGMSKENISTLKAAIQYLSLPWS